MIQPNSVILCSHITNVHEKVFKDMFKGDDYTILSEKEKKNWKMPVITLLTQYSDYLWVESQVISVILSMHCCIPPMFSILHISN